MCFRHDRGGCLDGEQRLRLLSLFGVALQMLHQIEGGWKAGERRANPVMRISHPAEARGRTDRGLDSSNPNALPRVLCQRGFSPQEVGREEERLEQADAILWCAMRLKTVEE